jgi:hypothetical protein
MDNARSTAWSRRQRRQLPRASPWWAPVRLRQRRRIGVALAAQEPLYAMPSHRAETTGCLPRPTRGPCYGKA